ncbi:MULTISPECIES: hypothetical protein [Pseudoalteromonas]|uniref:hypothetical protein n=1 Tax=Pseudoalteromonas TaxID=53246 RepID=UPI001581F247|nr:MULTISPECIES: hypothetical protein [Pseudoalteromonas]MDI4650881.1 hypothetical protein [Pseudoalteromonas shioyasakiensis]NUJ39011.1 hypothetical protein [Pseudoalteromonas sp. 0303]
MQALVRRTLYLFLTITGLTALMAIIGIAYVWFFSNQNELPHLELLIGSVILEIVAVVLVLAKKGLKYLPDSQIDKEPNDTIKFMESFISTGTSATIVSNRVSWLAGDQKLLKILQEKIDNGIRIEIITPKEVNTPLVDNLKGATFIVTNEKFSPEARFTLVNGERSGAEKLAIARGVHPDHEITIFDNNSGPQIIAMAKDIIRKSKELSHAS